MGEWGPIISFLLVVIAALLGIVGWYQRDFNQEIKKKVEEKVDRTDCRDDQTRCSRGPTWDVFDRHGHEGLPTGSRVVRG